MRLSAIPERLWTIGEQDRRAAYMSNDEIYCRLRTDDPRKGVMRGTVEAQRAWKRLAVAVRSEPWVRALERAAATALAAVRKTIS